MKYDLKDILSVAMATKRLRGQTISTVVTNMTKAYKLAPEDAILLEKAMIELTIGISSEDQVAHPTLSVRKALEYYDEACKSQDGKCQLNANDECNADYAKEAIADYICKICQN